MTRVVMAGLILASSLSIADDETPAEATGKAAEPQAAESDSASAKKPEPPKWFEKIQLEGLVDGYYSVRFQGNTFKEPADRVNELRAFDQANNTLMLGFAKVAVSMPAEPAGFRIDLGFGQTADLAGSDLGTPVAAMIRNIQQAYVSAKLFNRLTVDLGKFNTSAGSELIESNLNWLYSRSMLFAYGPYTHTGFRLSAPIIHDVWTVQAGVVNGWDTTLSSQIWKTFNFSTALTLQTGTSIYLNMYIGPQATQNIRWFFDLVVNQNIGEKFAMNLNAAFGAERVVAAAGNVDATWYGASLMAKYQPVDMVRISARVEYYGDPNGVRTSVAGAYIGTTLGVGVILSGLGNIEIRPEFRHDQAINGATPYVGGTSASQTTAQLAMVAWF